MTDENKDNQDQPNKAEPMDAKVRRRIVEAVQGEVNRLEKAAAAAQADEEWQTFANLVESIASIKARVEMYCVQIEMAVTTAALASMVGSVRAKPGDADPASLVRKADKPGGNSTTAGE